MKEMDPGWLGKQVTSCALTVARERLARAKAATVRASGQARELVNGAVQEEMAAGAEVARLEQDLARRTDPR